MSWNGAINEVFIGPNGSKWMVVSETSGMEVRRSPAQVTKDDWPRGGFEEPSPMPKSAKCMSQCSQESKKVLT